MRKCHQEGKNHSWEFVKNVKNHTIVATNRPAYMGLYICRVCKSHKKGNARIEQIKKSNK